jgi:hypothetical protein
MHRELVQRPWKITMQRSDLNYLLAICLAALSMSCNAQRTRFDVFTYAIPAGYTSQSSSSENARSYLKKDSTSGKFSLIIVYASTSGFGDPKTDFSRRWKQLINDAGRSSEAAKSSASTDENRTVTVGYTGIEYEGVRSTALLSTVSTKANRLITLLIVFNHEQALVDYQAFVSGLEIDGLNNQVATSTQSASVSSALNPSSTTTAVNQSIVGRWLHQVSYARSNAITLRDYVFEPDGTFVDRRVKKKGQHFGRYQVNGNVVSIVYDDGSTYAFRYEFVVTKSEFGGETRYMYITEEDGYVRNLSYEKISDEVRRQNVESRRNKYK